MCKQNGPKDYQHYRLPDEFWGALWNLRDYLLRDEMFRLRVLYPGVDDPLKESFHIVDNLLKRWADF
jgi:hypothetical protein